MAVSVGLLALAVLVLGGVILAVTAVFVIWIVTRKRRQAEGFPVQPPQPPVGPAQG